VNFGTACHMVLMFIVIVKIDDLRANYSASTWPLLIFA